MKQSFKGIMFLNFLLALKWKVWKKHLIQDWNASCEPIITWVWNANLLSSSLSNKKVGSMEELMETIDSIGLFVAYKHVLNK